MTDIHNFIEELMLFLTKEDVEELQEKAAVKFPLNGLEWPDLCYVCCWMALKKKLPSSIHNRMILGESNDWIRLYIKVLEKRNKTSSQPSVEELFNLAG